MWVRCGRIHMKVLLLTPLVVASLLAVYFFVGLMRLIFDNKKTNEMNDARGDSHRSPQVIIAQYIGTGNLMGQLSQDLVDRNNFSPVEGEGLNGRPVVIPPREMLKMQQQFKINSYNLLASDRIPLNRTLPDVRKKGCLLKSYGELPSTSIVIVFHNEAWSVLLRTVWSVINRSPRHLLKEIFLVDDASNRTFLGKPLDDYVAALPVPTKVLRLKNREGIIPARLLGASTATGDVLTFLDAHCECTFGWLEPLLYRIKENRENVVCPVIDIISDDNFGYMKSFELHSGAFNWQLHFRWYLMNSKELLKHHVDVTKPFPSPAMAGGLFSIDRKYFFEMGSYDSKMKIWGGDNLEMSFRIWQCGGRIEIIPCSHVGHLFRKSSPYTFPGGVGNVLNINLARTALVWMDDWAQFFFKFFRIPQNLTSKLDVDDRKLLRKELKCKSFEWYLENIWPDNFFPNSKRFFGKIILAHSSPKLYEGYRQIVTAADSTKMSNWTYIGHFLNSKFPRFKKLIPNSSMFCLTQPPNLSSIQMPYGQAQIEECRNGTAMYDLFVARGDGHLMANEGVCLDSLGSFSEEKKDVSIVRIVNCADTARQLWSYNFGTQQIFQHNSNHCIAAPDREFNKQKNLQIKTDDIDPSKTHHENQNDYRVHTEPCSTSKLQKWLLLPVRWK